MDEERGVLAEDCRDVPASELREAWVTGIGLGLDEVC